MCKCIFNSIKFIILSYIMLALFSVFTWYAFFYQGIQLFFEGFEIFLNIALSIILWGLLNRKLVTKHGVRLNTSQEILGVIKDSKEHLLWAISLYVLALFVYHNTSFIECLDYIMYEIIGKTEQSAILVGLIRLDNLMISRIFAVYVGMYLINIFCSQRIK